MKRQFITNINGRVLDLAAHYCLIKINPFPHTTILQQTTLNIFCQNIENRHNWMDNLWQKVEHIVAKARFVQFLLLSLCFQKTVCCRGVKKRLYEGKGLKEILTAGINNQRWKSLCGILVTHTLKGRKIYVGVSTDLHIMIMIKWYNNCHSFSI